MNTVAATASRRKIRLIICDDQPVYREGLARLLLDEADLQCVGLAGDGEEVVRLVGQLKPDVAVVGVRMARLDGVEATRRIKAATPQTAVLMISGRDQEGLVAPALQAGASGYLLKSAPLAEIVSAIRLVMEGGSVLVPHSAQRVLRLLCQEGRSRPGREVLQPRELEVLRLAARGLGNKQIARELFISERTVHTHLHRVFQKLGARSRTQAVIQAVNKGWLEMEAPLVEEVPLPSLSR